MVKYITYYRVSTDKQGERGLGLEAQRSAVESFIKSQINGTIIEEFTEIESGKKDDRPQLDKALKICRVYNAQLVVAKLDRLSRNVAFISKLMESGVKFIAADMPEANQLTIHIMAAMAEHEQKQTSDRIKDALKQAKLRGVRLGSPKCYLTDEDRKNGSKIGAEVRTKNAVAKAEDLMEIVEDIKHSGITSLRGLARELTKRNIPTPWGKSKWYPQTVKRLYERIEDN